MPLSWKFFRIICIVQVLFTTYFTFLHLFNFFSAISFGSFMGVLLFLLMLALAVLAISILNANYPETPVTGKQKSNFNRLFLLNFIFLVVLFGFIFAEYRSLKNFAALVQRDLSALPSKFFLEFGAYLLMLIFELLILVGLYNLRRELYFNFRKKKFDFE